MSKQTIRVLMVDDHALFLDLLGAGLELNPEFSIVGRAGTIAEAKRHLKDHAVDVVTLDLKLGTEGGLDLLRHITGKHKDTRVLVLTMMDHALYMAKARAAGASGYFFKGGNFDVLREAIRQVHSGRDCFPAAKPERRGLSDQVGKTLSDREFRVLEYLVQGMLIKEIGAELEISENSVSTYIRRSMGKLGVDSRAELLRFVMEEGLV